MQEKQAKRKQKKDEENVQPEPEQPKYYSSEWCEQNSEGMEIQIAIPSHDRLETLKEKTLKLVSHHHFPMYINGIYSGSDRCAALCSCARARKQQRIKYAWCE
jgi:hypothetical protein